MRTTCLLGPEVKGSLVGDVVQGMAVRSEGLEW